MNRCRFRILFCVALSVLAGGCGDRSDRLEVHPVKGRVFFEKKPAAGAMVVLHPQDKSDPRRLSARGRCDADGAFELSTYNARDGVANGRYTVTVEWRKTSGKLGDDESISLIPARYNRPEESPFQVEITPETTELKPIELTR